MVDPTHSVDQEPSICDDPRAIDYHQLRLLQHDAAWAQGRSLLDLQRAVASTDVMLTAWCGDTLVGCTRILTDFVFRAVLCDVIVHPDYRRRGIGRLLVRAATEHPRLAKVKKFTLLTEDAAPFYERLGWKVYPGAGMFYEREL